MSVLFSKRTWAVMLIAVLTTGVVGVQLDLGPSAWLIAGLLVGVLVSLTDLEAFGWREPRKPT